MTTVPSTFGPQPRLAGVPFLLLPLLLAACGGGSDDTSTTTSNAEKVACETLVGTTLAGGKVLTAAAIPAGDYTPPANPAPSPACPRSAASPR